MIGRIGEEMKKKKEAVTEPNGFFVTWFRSSSPTKRNWRNAILITDDATWIPANCLYFRYGISNFQYLYIFTIGVKFIIFEKYVNFL